MKRDILVFGEDWGSHPSSTQHLFKHISKNRRVIWVNSIGMRRPKFNFTDLKRITQKLKSILKNSFATKEHLTATQKTSSTEINSSGPITIIEPKIIPWPGNPIARYINRFLMSKQIGQKLGKHQVEKPILWTSVPTSVDFHGQFDECGIVYYCGDDFSSLAGVDHLPVERKERELTEQADVIFTASEKLLQKFPTKKSSCIPHGVDFERFSTPTTPALECQGSKPICGFYGSIAEWVDVELIAQTAKRLPDWEFMFIGPVKTDISLLLPMKNVTILPPQSHDSLPSFVQHWNAAILPFKSNDQITACNPLKLREYLASGTPIISTYFPALEPYLDQVQVIESTEDLCAALGSELHKIDPNIVAKESWSERANIVEKTLTAWD